MPDDRLAAAAAELYAAVPDRFTARRTELATAARDAGDRDAAKSIGALRRPTRAAWVVNTLARADRGAPRALAELAAALSEAQLAARGPRLRELSAERWALIDALTTRALAAAGVTDPSPSLRDEVTQTLSAALSDPAVAADFAAGTLTRAAQWSGFGMPAGTDASARSDASAGSKARASLRVVREPERADPADATDRRPARRSPSRPAEPTAREAAREGASAREAAERAALEAAQREAAERADRRREQRDEAERKAAAAAAAAAEANAAEDRLEAEVRDLEERLTRARDELAAARMRARRAEAAERRARQAFSNT